MSGVLMEFYKVTPNGNAHSVTLPKEELEALGVVDEDGELVGQTHACVTYAGDGQFTVNLVGVEEKPFEPDGDDSAALTDSEMEQLAAHAEELEG